ncbi:MAG: hypothetical protein ACLPVY_20370, partial [Acidimicrobiia bacterium]
MTATDVRHYRFGPRDRTGWFLGLGGVQCIAIGCGILASGVCLNLRLPVPVVFGPLCCAAGFAFGRWNDQPIHELTPIAFGWAVTRATGKTAWFAPPPRHRAADGLHVPVL